MEPKQLLSILQVAERLKCATRHCDTSTGRRESVAEHSWRLALMAMLVESEFPQLDMARVIKMCLIHDLGEAFTGDVPVFVKTEADTATEDAAFDRWLSSFPEPERGEWQALLQEMDALETGEARLYKALDQMEAVIQHNESDIASWLPLEYGLQLTHGWERARFSPYLTALREEVDRVTKEKIRSAGKEVPPVEHA